MRDLHHLDLVELVLADHAAGVAAGAARFRAEAGVCAVSAAAAAARHDLVAHEVGQRHFAGRDQVQRLLFLGQALLAALADGEQVFLELGQLAGAAQRRSLTM
jgi:hypothetical protein